MGVHIRQIVSDFLIYFYDDGKGYEDRDEFRAVAVAVVRVGRPRCVEIIGLLGRLEPGDTDELGKQLAGRGFGTLRAEVRKDVKVSRLLTLVEELEHTNIYFCNLSEI